MFGVLVNSGAIIVGTTLGLLLKKAIPDRVFNALIGAIGLCILFIGLDGALENTNSVIMILSLAIGAAIGTALDIDRRFNEVTEKFEEKCKQSAREKAKKKAELEGREYIETEENGMSLREAFVNSTLLFCVGAMAIVGSLNSGLAGDHELLITKAMLDGITSIIFAATMGRGVYGSAAMVFVYQGAIVLLSGFIKPILTDLMIVEMSAIGSLLILALGLNMLKITDIKVVNLMPAVFVVPFLCLIF